MVAIKDTVSTEIQSLRTEISTEILTIQENSTQKRKWRTEEKPNQLRERCADI